jgi:miniconductance mechanosensitive channel
VLSGSEFITSITVIVHIYLVLSLAAIASGAVDAFRDINRRVEVERNIPITSIIQAVNIGIYILAATIVFAIIINIDVWTLITFLGAIAAIIGIIFRGLILGFVASLQLSWNDMLAIGDWIEMPEYNADGLVEEINLTTVKVRNWDKTIITIPTYSMISHSVRNWRGMKESGEREIKRAVYIDMRSIRRSSPDMIERFSQYPYL